MNKLLKFTLLVLFSLITCMIAYMRYTDKEATRLREAVQLPNYTQIYQPQINNLKNDLKDLDEKVEFIDRKDFIKVIKEVSQEFDVPFIVRVRFLGHKNNGKGRVDYGYPLSNIIYFETQHHPRKEEEFRDHDYKVKINNSPIENLTNEQYQGASVFFKSDDKERILEALSQKFNKISAVQTSSARLENQPSWYIPSSPIIRVNDIYLSLIKLVLFFYFVFMFIWIILRNKEIAIFSLNGMSSVMILKRIYLKTFVGSQILVLFLANMLIIGAIDIEYIGGVLLIASLSMLGVWFIIGVIVRFSLAQQVNNKPFFKRVYIAVYLVKIYIFAVSVATSMGLMLLFNSSIGMLQSSPIKNYGTFHGGGSGYLESLKNHTQHESLFKYMENNGGLHASKKFLPQKFLEKYQAVEINSAYLQKYKIKDSNGKDIKIATEANEAVVLINERYKDKINEIKKGYSELLEMSGIGFKGTDIRFILMKDKQKIPVFQGEMGGIFSNGRKEEIKTDIVEVHTVNNAGVNTYINMFHNGNTLGALFPIKESVEKTYLDLLPSLREDKVESSFTSFVSSSKIAENDMRMYIGERWSWVFMTLLIFVLFVIMILSTTMIYFRVNKEKLALFRIQGFSRLRSYRFLFIIIIIQNIIFFTQSMILGYDFTVIEAFILYALIELYLVSHLLIRLEKKELVVTLKGA
ncbi:DUF1430 domain-containing protein [Lactococcus garvieae]|uniref:DUF1430 domain-containing protein n=1 Tax=Lactococcus garvieae TaxID=1363 RepID=UPI003853C8CB